MVDVVDVVDVVDMVGIIGMVGNSCHMTMVQIAPSLHVIVHCAETFPSRYKVPASFLFSLYYLLPTYT